MPTRVAEVSPLAGVERAAYHGEFDAAEYLDSEETMAEFLSAALETGDAAFIAESIGVIARAKGIAQIAEETGLGRTSLYKALRAEGNPAFSTVLQVMKALGLHLQAKPAVSKENVESGKRGANAKAKGAKVSASRNGGANKPTSKKPATRTKRGSATGHGKVIPT
ncbi:addiction module antidote protein [Ralstonia pickettii]|uniref:addiction module antidote protein n=1 Tax=Ralstonia pickettii TaxID=329 RepID=UPI002872F936|nr:addiction module antidote protein [Ralstonia pickettii]